MDDDAIRGLTVIKDGSITWPPPPPKLPRAGPPRPSRAMPAKEGARSWRAQRTDAGQQAGHHVRRRGAAVLLIGALRAAAFLGHFTVFVLACFVGYMVVWNVTPALHTPLMSVTNAISSIIAIGALVQIAPPLVGDSGGCAAGGVDPLAGGRRHRAHRHQHVRRFRRHPAHAGDVPQIRGDEHVCKPGNRLLYRSDHPFHPQPRRPVQPGDVRGAATCTA
jgi:hypothetical protein